MQLDAGYAAAVELAGQRLGAVLGAGEDHRPAGRAGQVDQHGHAAARGRRAARGGPSLAIGDCAESAWWVTGPARNRLTSTSIALSSVAEKSSRWPLAGVRSSSRRTDGQEAEVGHVVGLVEHGDLDRAEVAVTLADQVLEPAGAGDDDVDAAAEAGDLRVLADAAEDGDRVVRPAACAASGCERGLDLADELTGRRQDQRARAARRGAAAVEAEPGDQREQEGVGLAGAGAAAAEHVAAGERVGQRRRLDRGGRGDAAVCQHCGEVRRGRRGRRSVWASEDAW